MSFAVRSLLRRLVALVAIAVPFGVVAPSAYAYPEDYGLPAFKYSEFYIPPSPLPAGKPGDVIRSREMNFRTSYKEVPRGLRGWLVMYLSTSATGQPIAVTGTILFNPNKVPTGGVDRRPIVAYGNEAQGLGDNCAVSRLLEHGSSGEVEMWTPMIRAGWVVASSDYEGLGTPDTHTFGVTMSAAHTQLDMLRATRNMAQELGIPSDGPLGMIGYSQGGAAVGGAAEIAPTYAPELKIEAAAFGGAPIDPLHVSKYVDGGFFSSVNFGASVGYDVAYPELDLDSFLNAKGEKMKKTVLGACIEMIFPLTGKRSVGFLNPGMSPLKDPRWIKRFQENTLGRNAAPKVPTYYWHGQLDEASPLRDARTMRRQYCAAGTQLRYVEIPLIDHVYAGPWWIPQAEKWLAARLEGKRPDKGNCRSGYVLGGLFPGK